MGVEYIGYSIDWSDLEKIKPKKDGLTLTQFNKFFDRYREQEEADVGWYSQSVAMSFNAAYDVVREELDAEDRLLSDSYYGKFHWCGPSELYEGTASAVDPSIDKLVSEQVYLDLELDNWRMWETCCMGGLYSPQTVNELNALAVRIDFDKINELLLAFYPNPDSWPVKGSPNSDSDSKPNFKRFRRPEILEAFEDCNCFFSAEEACEAAARMVDALSAASVAGRGFYITLQY